MSKYIILYRSGGTHKMQFTEEVQNQIADDWDQWVADLGDSYVQSSPIQRGGIIVSSQGETEVEVSDEMVNGYIIVQANIQDEVIEMSKNCPLFKVGKVFEIRKLPSH